MREIADDSEGEGFVSMNAEQARIYRKAHPALSPWLVVMGQLVMGLMAVLASWAISQSIDVALSVGCGALAVILPGAMFARGLMGRFASLNPANAVTSFFVWELVKIVMTVAVLLMAHRWVVGLSWPAMLAGLVVTMKVYWLALLVKGKRQPVED